jgi:hypothetical protein
VLRGFRFRVMLEAVKSFSKVCPVLLDIWE